MKKKFSITSLLLISSIVVLFFVLYNQQEPYSSKAASSEKESLSYDRFVTLNKLFEDTLQEKYKNVIQPKNIIATTYSANEGGDWAKGEMDLMEGDDLSRPLKQRYELIDTKSGFYTQIVLTYAPQLTEKSYLNTTRIYGTENEDPRLPKETTITDLAINTLSFPGIFIEILTTPIYKNEMKQVSEKQEQMVNENGEVTRTLQKFFNEQSSSKR